jgi:hypothetical protein
MFTTDVIQAYCLLSQVLSELRPRPEKLASSGERPFQKERSVGTSNAKKALFGAEVGKVSLVSLSVV